MIKRTFTSALVAVALTACQSNKDTQKENAEAAKQQVPETKVYDVRDVNFLTPEERTARYGQGWENNPAITRHIKSDVAVEIDMTDSRQINLQYEKQFALNVIASNKDGYGSVSIEKQWVKVGDSITIMANSDDKATFHEWLGDIEDAELAGDSITVKMDRPRNISAAFLSNIVEFKINSEYGDPKGSGSYDRGTPVQWSVTSPVAINDTERVVTRDKTGSALLNDGDFEAYVLHINSTGLFSSFR